jgi:predicted transcriptional regulator
MEHTEKPFNYARKRLMVCRLSDSLTSVAKLFESDVGSALVKDAKGSYIGMITDSMIFKAIASGVNVTQLKVGDLKLEPLVTVGKNADIGEVLEAFKKTPSNRIAMVDSKGNVVAVLKKSVLERFFRFELGSRMAKKR